MEKSIQERFNEACYSGNLQEVKRLLSTQQLDTPLIKKENGSTLSFTCLHGQTEVVKFLLTDSIFRKFSDINADGDNALSFACMSGHKDIVQYLLTSSELTEHSKDVNFGLKCAKSYDKPEIVKYLIFDYGLELTPELKKLLKKDTGKDLMSYQQIEQIFNSKKQLQQSVKMKI